MITGCWRLPQEAFAPLMADLQDLVAGFPWSFPPPPQTEPSEYPLSKDALQNIIRAAGDLHHTHKKCTVRLRDGFGAQVSDKIGAHLAATGITAGARLSGTILYPPGGWMGWHTNSDRPGWRFYINYVVRGGDSFFRWYDGQTVHTDADTPGFNFRLFPVGDRDHPFWHCVYAGEWRLSLGHRFREANPDAIQSAIHAGRR
jgi:hypothetical protein